ncbi:RimJ/RimL family protein N-acetyltransferase [Cytobacillus purgationiresistens]|uniref:RimJ/RimL family protein N-acetyltransferase n=1 Tax=Cytobacillus purgationiresistens TaxID=863449 RepID=A0ABU0AQJ3_9BACI|nr:RimJ/RimL family protein N-acetyltransferase [Cytobacillus purgationiresistens]
MLEVRTGKLRYSGTISISIDEQWQNKGIGSRLLDALLELADLHLGLTRIELEVTSANSAAVHLYEKQGFEKEGLLSNGGFHDVIIMGRVL